MNEAKRSELSEAAGSPRPLVIPRVGDEWEWKLPGKPRRRKVIGHIVWTCFDSGRRLPVVWTKHAPKGRGIHVRVKWLLKNGRRLSTAAERDAAMDARFAAGANTELRNAVENQSTPESNG